MVANFSTAKQLWWPDYLQQNDLNGLFSGVWAESLMKQVVVAHSARGSGAGDASCTCTCSLPAECCAAADCSAAAVFAVTGMINNCCCCCCTDDNSPSAVSTDRTLHTHSCTLAHIPPSQRGAAASQSEIRGEFIGAQIVFPQQICF